MDPNSWRWEICSCCSFFKISIFQFYFWLKIVRYIYYCRRIKNTRYTQLKDEKKNKLFHLNLKYVHLHLNIKSKKSYIIRCEILSRARANKHTHTRSYCYQIEQTHFILSLSCYKKNFNANDVSLVILNFVFEFFFFAFKVVCDNGMLCCL